jgi:proton-dependent oligopeptide transporter, POT family
LLRSTNPSSTEAGSKLFGHPKGLYVLALTEMWERFSFYGMRALLVFFLTQRFQFSDQTAFAVYGGYAALVYVSPVLGGLLADRYLGFSRAVVFGGLLMVCGHFGLAVEDLLLARRGSAQAQVFYLSLAFLIAGVGLLKPNISTMVGGLYPDNGHLRDSGFTVFVCGINFGAAISAVVCGYVGQKYGWGYGFGIAGLGILLGLAIFVGGQRHLRGIGAPPDPAALGRRVWAGVRLESAIYLATLLAIVGVWRLVQMPVLGYVVGASFLIATAGTIAYAYRRLDLIRRQQLFAALALMGVWVCFAALIEQTGSSLNLFTERVVDRSLEIAGASGAYEMRSAQLQGLLPFLVILFSPLFAWLWGYLERHHLNPSTPVKFALSLLFLGAGYGAVFIGMLSADGSVRVPLAWLLLLYGLFAIGDLLIVPVGLSVTTKLATAKLVGFMMGLWMLSVAIGNFLSAAIAGHSAVAAHSAAAVVFTRYRQFFGILALVSAALGGIVWALTPPIRKWMHGVR